MEAGIQMKVDAINEKLDGITQRVNGIRAYFARVVYAQYQKAQIEQWKSAGTGQGAVTTSEGNYWEALSPAYYKRKTKKYADYDYGGKQFLVATGALLKKVIQPDKITTNYSLTLRVPTTYAKFVAEKRPFMSFGDRTRQTIEDGIAKFLLLGHG